MRKINAFLRKHRESYKPCVVYRDWQFSYFEVNRISRNLAGFLRDLQIKEENIAIFAGNSPEYIFAYFANAFTDSTNIPINVKLADPEITSEISYCDCNWVLTQSQYIDRLLRMSRSINFGIIEINKCGDAKLIKQAEIYKSRENKTDIAVMLHTSGTTGDPKKVMLSHRNLYANTQSNIDSLKLTGDDVVLVALPLFFGYCHTAQFLTHTRLGGTIVIFDEPVFSAKHFCELVERYHVTCFTGVPTMLTMLDEYPYFNRYDLSCLRYICFGGGSVSLEMLQRLIKKIPNIGLVQTYGQTECSPRVTALLPEDSIRKIGSVGKTIPGVLLEIVNEMDDVALSGQVGEIRVKGENITPGYYKNSEESRKILKNGWLYTGDFAKYDDDGYIYLVGRKKNIIISGGINLYPEDIERVIMNHPAVEDVLVKGKEDAILGEIPIAYVKPREGSDITIGGLHNFLNKKLAQYKWPKELFIVESLKKTSTGKTKRQFFLPSSEQINRLSSFDVPPNTQILNALCTKGYDLVVSLGTTCQTAYQLKRLNLRKWAGPFDWFITPFESMLKLLENNFENFMERKYLKIIGEYQDTNTIIEDSLYYVRSYHDFTLPTSNHNIDKLYPAFKDKINRRIQRFLMQLDRLDEILLVVNAGNVSLNDYLRLVNILGRLRRGKKFHVLATGYFIPQTDKDIENISFVRFTKFLTPKRDPAWRRGCNEEWNKCARYIRLKINKIEL